MNDPSKKDFLIYFMDKVLIKKASVAAIVEETGGIGYENDLPWPKLLGDFSFLKFCTTNQFSLVGDGHLELEPVPEVEPTVVMGRRTYESIGKRTLPKRRNVILSSQQQQEDSGVECIRNVKDSPGDLVYFLGGASVYKDAMAMVDAVFLTKVSRVDGAEIPADVYFPLQELKEQGFENALDITAFVQEHLNLAVPLDEGRFLENGYAYRFFVYF